MPTQPMFVRAVMLAAPSVAMTVVGIALLGPGRLRPFDGARVWGGPTGGAARLSWRIELVRRFRGVDSSIPGKTVVVRASAGGGDEGVGSCVSGPEGICDVELQLRTPPGGPLILSVAGERPGELFASGSVSRARGRWGDRPSRSPEIAGRRSGDLAIRVYALRGVVAAPFPEELALFVVGPAGEPRASARVTAHIDIGEIALAHQPMPEPEPGASAGGPLGRTLELIADVQGRAELSVVARAHSVELTLEASSAGAAGSFTGWLPVVPGAMWLDPEGKAAGSLRVVSPVAHPWAYATLATRTARLWGGVVPLVADQHGFAGGDTPWPSVPLPSNEPVWLTLATDAEGHGSGTVGWPITSAQGDRGAVEQAFPDWLLLDGLPEAERRETDRRRRAVWLVATALGAAAGLEAILLIGGARARGADGWSRVAAAVAAILLAFAAIGIVAVWKAAG